MCAQQDALYRVKCLLKLYREANRARFGTETDDTKQKCHVLAFSRVKTFIDEKLYSSDGVIPTFKLADLIKYYSKCLVDLGVTDHYIHSTRFKERIKEQYEDMIESTQGRDIILAFKGDIGDIISNAVYPDFNNEGKILVEASAREHVGSKSARLTVLFFLIFF